MTVLVRVTVVLVDWVTTSVVVTVADVIIVSEVLVEVIVAVAVVVVATGAKAMVVVVVDAGTLRQLQAADSLLAGLLAVTHAGGGTVPTARLNS